MKKTSINYRTSYSVPRLLGAVVATCVLVFTVSVKSSLAFNTYEGLYDDPASSIKEMIALDLSVPLYDSYLSVPSSATADVCLPLLKQASHILSASAMDRNQRSAGKAAALGLVFGVRFALSPPVNDDLDASNQATLDVLTPHLKTKDTQDRSALTVMAYRKCQKQEALKALSASR